MHMYVYVPYYNISQFGKVHHLIFSLENSLWSTLRQLLSISDALGYIDLQNSNFLSVSKHQASEETFSFHLVGMTISHNDICSYVGRYNSIFSVMQQNYLTKTVLNGSVFLCENPIFMSVQIVVIPLGITTTWTHKRWDFHGEIRSHPSPFWQGNFAV